MSGQTIFVLLIFAQTFAHKGILVGCFLIFAHKGILVECFLLIVIAILALVVLYQRFAFRRGIQTKLIQISRKLEEISESDSDEKVMVFTDEPVLMELIGEINRLLLDRQKVRAEFKRGEIASKKMLANISHDIKTPLTVILGYLEIMRLADTDDEMRKKVEAKAKQVVDLINQFFTLAKLEAGDANIIIEFPTFYEHMSGRDNLKLHCEYMGYYSRDSLAEALEMLGLLEAADKPVKRYSLGMKQRLGIARAILCKPELVVLDEPTNGLDPAGMKQIRNLFWMLKEEYGMTFLISSHLLSEIESIADTIGIISHGELLREFSMQEISEMNTDYIELAVENTQKAAYTLSEKLNLSNFKIMNDSRIRIYEPSAAAQSVSKELLLNGVEMISITKHTESLEDYFLKLTEEVEKSCEN